MPPLLKIALLLLVLIGGIYDLRTRKIPNWLNLSGLSLGVGFNAILLRGTGVRESLLGLGLALLVYLPLYAVRGMGAGDVKLMAAVGSIAGPQNWFGIFLATTILGGAVSLALILSTGRLYVTLARLSLITGELLHARLPFRRDESLDVRHQQAVGLPHGALIAVGSMVFLWFANR